MIELQITGDSDNFMTGPHKHSSHGAVIDESDTVSEDTSSIGKNSDDEEGEDAEVQSSYKGFLDNMNALEEVLPIRRGISSFYNGKSKSFTSLMDVSSCAKEIAKPENAYSRRRRNLIAWDRSKGGISKRPIMGSSKSHLAIAVAIMSCSESLATEKTAQRLPPRHPRGISSASQSCCPQTQDGSPWRSFSVVDLPQCKLAASSLSFK